MSLIFLCLVSVLFFAGCMEKMKAVDSGLCCGPEMVAYYTETPVNIDGKLDDAIWQSAKTETYYMYLSADKEKDAVLAEGGKIRIAWDDKYFYLACEFTDSDVVAEGDKDQLHHYQLGDLCELFLKPADKSWYWEIYMTPRNNKSVFFFPSKGYLGLPSCFEDYIFDFKVAAQVDGTLNNWHDKDKGWTGEMAIPIKELTARGETFGPDSRWRIFVGRYNYSVYFTAQELSMSPQLSKTNYHLIDEYASLILKK